MKYLITTIISFFALTLAAQLDGINYQAVILSNEVLELPGQDLQGNVLSYGTIALKFTITDANGSLIYQEVQNTETDMYGMVSVIIGQGAAIGSTTQFNQINWDGQTKNLGVELSYDGVNFEALSEQPLLFVPYAYHRDITATGTLTVDQETLLGSDLTVLGDATFNGNTTFNTIEVQNTSDLMGPVTMGSSADVSGNLSVNNGSNASFSGNMLVGGNSILDGSLMVGNNSPATFTGNVSTVGTTTMGGAVSIINQSPFNASGTITAAGNATFNSTMTVGGNATFNSDLAVEGDTDLNGQVTINAGINGSDGTYNNYGLKVEGSQQGIAIKTNGGRNSSRNFVSFWDVSGVHGCIEGQTMSELHNSFRFIWDVTMGGLNEAFVLAEGVACGFQLDAGEVGVMGFQGLQAYVQWIELTNDAESNVGVSFSSGGADYAEWLPCELSTDDLQAGEVVGIFGGKISRRTHGADEVRVVSTNPIVVGNLDVKSVTKSERVAFLGQAPVRVVGKVDVGDYLLPSGDNDGLAIALKASDVPTIRYAEIIGVAWEAGEKAGVNIVNTAIGLNANDLAVRLGTLEDELATLRHELEEIKRMLSGEKGEPVEGVVTAATLPNETTVYSTRGERPETIRMTDNEFEKWVKDYGYIFEDVMAKKREYLQSIGVDYTEYEHLKTMLDAPVQALRDMRSGRYMESVWKHYESQAVVPTH
ncbi:MAG: hypothetical protein GC193_15265 [Cryomorphaceae bacterium]|nr:hypothetical protein [Cryomorphaceae bacterium]